ncbi:hypothetical protein AXF42_Ash010602 [Apostasia shenzhenica]|uniref:Uncharacterized protein n=1 Tax=Apostasia shenzhenica TaxID=1088818 RepID=A0A2I0A6J4_9ASPA|nr:hypothetical protein AXF42_Ash010602 [Apostasia shenzhenica]
MDFESLNDKVEGLSSQISCLENGMACNVDSQSLKLVGRFSCSASYFESGEVIESSPSDQTEDEDMVFLSHTPSEIIFFDPFAPGPNYLRNAPKKKMMKCSDACFQRQLNFDSGSDSEEVFDADKLDDLGEERSFLSSVFLSLLELIISAHLEEISADNQVADSDQIEDYKTPISSPLLTGIAETCPPAPQKPALTSKILDHSICRKLDFESCLTES